MYAESGENEGDEDAGDDEDGDAPPLVPEQRGLQLVPRLEQQDREEDVEDEVAGEPERVQLQREADDQADEDEADDVRNADAPRQDGDGGGDDEQQDERLLGPRPSSRRETRGIIGGAGAAGR